MGTGANLGGVDPTPLGRTCGVGWTCLMKAVYDERVDLVDLLLSQPSIDVNAKNSVLDTALHKAQGSCLLQQGHPPQYPRDSGTLAQREEQEGRHADHERCEIRQGWSCQVDGGQGAGRPRCEGL